MRGWGEIKDIDAGGRGRRRGVAVCGSVGACLSGGRGKPLPYGWIFFPFSAPGDGVRRRGGYQPPAHGVSHAPAAGGENDGETEMMSS